MEKDPQPNFQELFKVAQQIQVEMKKLQKNPKWQKYSDKPCQMSKMEIDGAIASQGICIVNYAIQKIVQFLSQVGVLKRLNSTCVQDKQLWSQKDVKVTYMQYSAPWPVSHRDFVTVAYNHKQSDDKYYIGSKSCNYPYPQQKKIVRGQVVVGGYILERIDENKTKVTYFSHADIKGSIPAMIKNQLAKKQGQIASRIEQVMKKQGK